MSLTDDPFTTDSIRVGDSASTFRSLVRSFYIQYYGSDVRTYKNMYLEDGVTTTTDFS